MKSLKIIAMLRVLSSWELAKYAASERVVPILPNMRFYNLKNL